MAMQKIAESFVQLQTDDIFNHGPILHCLYNVEWHNYRTIASYQTVFRKITHVILISNEHPSES